MKTPCAKHVVVRAASKGAIASVNFMVVPIGESLELVDSLYFKKYIRSSSISRPGVVLPMSMVIDY